MTEISIKKAIPANVIILSGAQVDTSNKVKYNDSNEIPKITGKIGGKLTTAWIGVMSRYIKDGKLTWFEMLERTKQTLESDGFHDQLPQLLSSHKFNVQNPLRLFPGSSKSTIRVLLIGMQYSQQPKEHQIFHAHSQVEDTRQYLSKYHDVSFKRMDILTDQKDQVQPTRKNILVGMQKLSRATKPGDSALVLICGHAGRIQTKTSGEQETLLPIDFKSEGPITQEDIYKHLICSMPAKSNLVCIFDLVESGSLVDLPFLYKQNQTTDRFNFISNVAFELELVIGLAIAAAALGVGASSGDGNCDDCCPSCCDSILNDLFH